MQVTLSKQVKSKCRECGFNFTPNSVILYCCDPLKPVCFTCRSRICLVCKKERTSILKVQCTQCQQIQSYVNMFQYFDNKDILLTQLFCVKCVSKKFMYFYENMLKQGKNPETYTINFGKASQCCLKYLIQYLRKWCFCCCMSLDQGNNAFQMIYGARLCGNCTSSNFQLALPKLLFCVSCNGYIHNFQQISERITSLQIICTYCAKHQKQQMEIIKGEKSEKKRLDKNIFASALEISKLSGKSSQRQQQSMNQLNSPYLKKAISIAHKNSLQNFVEDYPLQIKFVPNQLFCSDCNCMFDKQNMINKSQNEYVCHICYRNIYEFGLEKLIIVEPSTIIKTGKISSNPPNSKVIFKTKTIPCIKCQIRAGEHITKSGLVCSNCLI